MRIDLICNNLGDACLSRGHLTTLGGVAGEADKRAAAVMSLVAGPARDYLTAPPSSRRDHRAITPFLRNNHVEKRSGGTDFRALDREVGQGRLSARFGGRHSCRSLTPPSFRS